MDQDLSNLFVTRMMDLVCSISFLENYFILQTHIHTLPHPSLSLSYTHTHTLSLSLFLSLSLPVSLSLSLSPHIHTLSNVFFFLYPLKALYPATPVILRQAAVAYVASFLARANYVDLAIVHMSLERLVEWLNR